MNWALLLKLAWHHYNIKFPGVMASHSQPQQIWTNVWHFVGIHPKVRALRWRLLSGSLPLCSRLARFIPSIVATCPFCGTLEESADHLFFKCVIVQQVWVKLGFNAISASLSNDEEILSLWQKQFTRCTSNELRRLFFYALWCIWTARNEKVFLNIVISVPSISARAAVLYKSNNDKGSSPQIQCEDLLWQKPREAAFKLTVDAAHKHRA